MGHKAICSKDKKILNVGIFNDEFIEKLIKTHNNELYEVYKKGIFEGIDIQSQVSRSL